MTCLAAEHDCLLLDLDGTVFRGSEPTAGAVATLASVSARTLFITNNASRAADEVAEHLRLLGISLEAADVVTSAQSAARLLATELPSGTPVLVVGTDALAAELSSVGLRPVRSSADKPAAVVQGHSPITGWSDLAEACLAIRGGALWVATNIDATLPTERGLLPGNGSMVAALRAATGSEPRVAGKPQPDMLRDALARGDFSSPLVVGDRLDTDIAGANAAELPSLLVLTGVSTAGDVIRAAPQHRPTYVAEDLRSLNDASRASRVCVQPAWRVDVDGAIATVTSTATTAEVCGLSVIRAAAHAVWRADLKGRSPVLVAGDDNARTALDAWSLCDRIA